MNHEWDVCMDSKCPNRACDYHVCHVIDNDPTTQFDAIKGTDRCPLQAEEAETHG